jgi:hypothetical protein
MSTREIRPIDMQMVVEFLREKLRIEVETESNYTGDMDGSGSLYSNSHTIRLTLDGEVISETSI